MKNYENSKVDISEITDNHISILLQTMADILAEKNTPNVKPILKLSKK